MPVLESHSCTSDAGDGLRELFNQRFLRERDREPLFLSLTLLHTTTVCYIKFPTSAVPVAPPNLVSPVPFIPTNPSACLSPPHALSTLSPLGFILCSQRECGNSFFNLSCRYSLIAPHVLC